MSETGVGDLGSLQVQFPQAGEVLQMGEAASLTWVSPKPSHCRPVRCFRLLRTASGRLAATPT